MNWIQIHEEHYKKVQEARLSRRTRSSNKVATNTTVVPNEAIQDKKVEERKVGDRVTHAQSMIVDSGSSVDQNETQLCENSSSNHDQHQ